MEREERIAVELAVAEEEASIAATAVKIKEDEAAVKTRRERETLIAEAGRLAGRVEGLNFISKVAVTASLVTLKQIKDNKIYRDLPGVGTWENYCTSIGYTRRYIDEQLDNIATFGNEFLAVTASFGVDLKKLRQLKKASISGSLAIEADTVIIEGETIPLSDKDELKEALENLVAEQNRRLKEKESEIKSKAEALEEAGKKIKSKDTVNAAHVEMINRLSDELDRAKNTVTFSDGTHLESDPVYQALLMLEHRADSLITEFQMAAKREDLSEFHQNIFGGLFMHFFKRLDDVRQTLTDKDEAHFFDNFYLTEADKIMAGNMMTPSRWMHEQDKEEE